MSKVLIKQTVLYSIGELVPKIIAFVLLPVYMRYLTAGEYGILSYTAAVVMFIYVLSSFSLNSFVLRKYSELHDEVDKKKLIGNIFLLIATLNLLFLIIGYLLIPIFIKKYDIQIPWDPYFKYAVLINFLEGFSIIPLIIYRVKQKANLFVLLSLSKTLMQLVLTYYFIVMLNQGLVGNYLGQLYPLFFFFFVYFIIILKEGILNINFAQIKEGLRFSWPLLPGSIAFLALGLIDRVILERYVPIAQLGVYNVAYLISLSVNIVISSGYKALEPQIFIKYREANFVDFIRNAQAVFLFVVYSTAMAVAIFSQEVFKLMTSSQFYEGYLLVPVIMVGVIMTGQNVIFGGILIAEKNTKIVGLSTIIGAIVNIVFNFIFIPLWGTFAAALSVAVSFTVINLMLYWKINLKGVQIKPELYSLLLFLIINIFLFYIFNVQFSLVSFIIKIIVFIIYVYLLTLIYNFKFSSFFRLLGVSNTVAK